MHTHRALHFALFALLVISITACSGTTNLVGANYTPMPTATEAPMAARVNGEGILLTEYQNETLRLLAAQQALEIELDDTQQKEKVLNELITQTLFAQGASLKGHFIDEAALQQRMDDLVTDVGGVEKLAEWMTSNYYDETSLRYALRRNMAAAWMRDQIIADVGDTADQVHVRQIRVDSLSEAQTIQQRLQGDTDFTALAREYDPIIGGDLGWFPKGYLFQPEVDEAAFALQPGQTSEIIATEIGYHVIQVIERDSQHVLTPDAKLFLQHQALDQWLAQKRSVATIEILVP